MNKALSTLLAGAAGGLITLGASKLMDKPQLPSAPTSNPTARLTYGGGPAPFDFSKAADKAMPVVVHIKASESQRITQQRYRNDPFSFFFGDYQPREGTGSGVIYTEDGYILTNNHVVEFADEFLVTLHDNREFRARLVGRDASTDMAVLKIDAKDLPAVELTNSDDVRVGEWAIAVGNPFDLASTVTAGIVSAKGRNINIIREGASIESFIQTDAAVNPGNSGGALVDINGKLIGINSAIASPTGAYAGYAFAIPTNLAKRIADDLIKYGKFKRGYLGVDIAVMNEEIAEQLHVPNAPGIIVTQLDPRGSASRAGIQKYDIITKIEGKSVMTLAELRERVGIAKSGDVLQMIVSRNGKEMQIPVKMVTTGGE
jgi:serine protease Do